MFNETPVTPSSLFRPSTFMLLTARVPECLDISPPALATSPVLRNLRSTPSLHGRSLAIKDILECEVYSAHANGLTEVLLSAGSGPSIRCLAARLNGSAADADMAGYAVPPNQGRPLTLATLDRPSLSWKVRALA
jgi:hypothetical protein